MCGRFSLTASPEQVADLFGLEEIEDFPPRYNIAPTQPVLMTHIDAANNKVAGLVRWGLVPDWVKDPKEFTLLINARSETASSKPSFRNAMRHRRSLLPASGFYEWYRPVKSATDKEKQAYWITPNAGQIVAFGALIETWCGADGSEIDSGCILTTSSNTNIANIHHRMPVVIKPKDFDQWLDCKTQEPKHVAHLMQPVEDNYFQAITVSNKVNKVANFGPELQNEIVKEQSSTKLQEHTTKNSGENPERQLDLF